MMIEAASMILAMASKCSTVMSACSRKPQRTSTVSEHDHGEAGEQGADDEVGRKDRLLPAGHQARREIEADDAVHRDHQRHGERRHASGGGFRSACQCRAEPRQPSAKTP